MIRIVIDIVIDIIIDVALSRDQCSINQRKFIPANQLIASS